MQSNPSSGTFSDGGQTADLAATTQGSKTKFGQDTLTRPDGKCLDAE